MRQDAACQLKWTFHVILTIIAIILNKTDWKKTKRGFLETMPYLQGRRRFEKDLDRRGEEKETDLGMI